MSNVEKLRSTTLVRHGFSVAAAKLIQQLDPDRPERSFCVLTVGEIDTERKQLIVNYEWQSLPEEEEE